MDIKDHHMTGGYKMARKFILKNYLIKNTFGYKNKCLIFFMGILMLYSSGCSKNIDEKQSQLKEYPIDSEVFTTHQKTVVPDLTPGSLNSIFPYEISKYKENGYGTWHYSLGIDTVKRLDIMATTYNSKPVTNAAKLLNFFTISDIHITDEESPAQAVQVGYKGGNSSGYSPTMMLTTQVLDAAVQTINKLHKQSPLDFGISLGDVTNNMQYNELRWYVDVLDGKNINPDSGVKDDPVLGSYNDYQDEYKAAGLDKNIPWYQTFGNHDYLGMGAYPINDDIKKMYVGKEILNLGNVFTDPAGINSRGFYMGSIDGSTVNGDIIGAGAVSEFKTPPQILAEDSKRRPVTRKEWMKEFFITTSKPVGHGFTQTNLDSDFASYSFEPKTNIPIKVIVLDDNQSYENFNIKGQGDLDKARYDWLVNELEKGQAEDKLMIISAHMPSSLIGLTSNSPIDSKTLLEKLQKYPNLILWIAGHRHRNTITAIKSPDNAKPELGFWEVETSSLRDFPQQFRTFQIVRNSDKTVSIFTTNIDPSVKEGSLAALSRSYAMAAQQLFKSQTFLLPTGSYNAELVKQLSPEMQKKMENYGTLIDK